MTLCTWNSALSTLITASQSCFSRRSSLYTELFLLIFAFQYWLFLSSGVGLSPDSEQVTQVREEGSSRSRHYDTDVLEQIIVMWWNRVTSSILCILLLLLQMFTKKQLNCRCGYVYIYISKSVRCPCEPRNKILLTIIRPDYTGF